MTVWLVTRHEGAAVWLERRGWRPDRVLDHLDDAAIVARGDVVLGVLPMRLAAAMTARGARFIALELGQIPRALRGETLDADAMDRIGVSLVEYRVEAIENPKP